MGACKAKEIQAYLGTFKYIPAYSGILGHTYSRIIRHIQKLFRHSTIADKINETISRNQAKLDRIRNLFDTCFRVIFGHW